MARRKETVGQRIKRLRLAQGRSQRSIASPGCSYAYVSRVEAGARVPSVKALRKMAEKLGVSVFYLEHGRQQKVYVLTGAYGVLAALHDKAEARELEAWFLNQGYDDVYLREEPVSDDAEAIAALKQRYQRSPGF